MVEGFDHTLYCGNQQNWSELHASAQQFLENLGLSASHPRCHDEAAFTTAEFLVPKVEELPTELMYEQEMGLLSRLVTIWYQIAPALLAMSELWLRLFAFVLAPSIVLYFITKELRGPKNELSLKQERKQAFFLIVGLASSLVLLTDTMYVQCYNGRQVGVRFFVFMVLLTLKRLNTFNLYRNRMIMAMFTIMGLTSYLIAHSERQGTDIYAHPGLDIATIQPGFYYSQSNPLMSKVAELWPAHTRTYDVKNGATPYLPTGDSLTGIPFLINKVEQQQTYNRVWVQNDVDKEAVALDIKFPSDGIHNTQKPLFLLLHGLNGGSHEEYVQEFVERRTKEGHTCIVMVARGLMDTPVVGWNVFHGARILDVDTAAKVISKAKGPNQILAGVGYSMGAIVISNYVARSGEKCHLDAAMSISGGLDMREMLSFKRSMRLWQPMLAQTLRDDFIVTKFDNRFRYRLTKEEYITLMRASSVSEIDIYAIVSYNGFDDLEHYYTEMSAMGDTAAFQAGNDSTYGFGRIADVSIPFCVLHALDDPLTSWRTIGHDPEKLVNTGSGNIMLVLTSSGGHVGWPMGYLPQRNGWKFMNDAASNFVNSVHLAKNSAA